jgi:XTP/dITP diphosphohydrolase
MITICFATNNQHKLYEVRDAVPEEIKIVSLEEIHCFEELPETSDTLEGNSFQKAAYVLEHHKIPCFADDTGLEVEALNGEPGVYSARFAGPQRNSEDNVALLLERLEKKNNRKARFRTVITLVGFEPEPLFFEGIINGEIIRSPRGSKGFGYDPVFQPEGFTSTFAEMDLAQKNSLSHRAIAVKKLSTFLLLNKFS